MSKHTPPMRPPPRSATSGGHPLTSPLLTKEDAARLRAHERSVDEEAPFSSSGNPLIELTPDLARKLKLAESLERDTATVTAEAARIRRKDAYAHLLGSSQPLKVGLSGDLLPTAPEFDICIDSQIQPDGTRRQVAWIPVLVHLCPKQSSFTSKTGEKVSTLELGRSTFTDSYATVTVFTTTEDPSSPGTFIPTTVAVRGFASLSLHPKSPQEVLDALQLSDLRSPFNSSPTDVAHPDETSRSLSTPAFIPSHGPESARESTSSVSPTRVIPGSAMDRIIKLASQSSETLSPSPPHP